MCQVSKNRAYIRLFNVLRVLRFRLTGFFYKWFDNMQKHDLSKELYFFLLCRTCPTFTASLCNGRVKVRTNYLIYTDHTFDLG